MGATLTLPLYPDYQPKLRSDGPVFLLDGQSVTQLKYLDWQDNVQNLGPIAEAVRIKFRPPEMGVFKQRGTQRWQLAIDPQNKTFTAMHYDLADQVTYTATYNSIEILNGDGYPHTISFYTPPPPPTPTPPNPLYKISSQGLISISPWSSQDLCLIFLLLVLLLFLVGTGIGSINTIKSVPPTTQNIN